MGDLVRAFQRGKNLDDRTRRQSSAHPACRTTRRVSFSSFGGVHALAIHILFAPGASSFTILILSSTLGLAHTPVNAPAASVPLSRSRFRHFSCLPDLLLLNSFLTPLFTLHIIPLHFSQRYKQHPIGPATPASPSSFARTFILRFISANKSASARKRGKRKENYISLPVFTPPPSASPQRLLRPFVARPRVPS